LARVAQQRQTNRQNEKAPAAPLIFARCRADFLRVTFVPRALDDRFRQISQRFPGGKMLFSPGQNTLQAELQIATFPPVVDSEKIHRNREGH